MNKLNKTIFYFHLNDIKFYINYLIIIKVLNKFFVVFNFLLSPHFYPYNLLFFKYC